MCTRVQACMRACICTCVCACTCACKFATVVYPRKRHMLCRLGLKSLNCHAISSSSYFSVTIVIIDHHRHRGRHHHNLSMQQHSSKHLSSVRQLYRLYVQGFLRIRNIVELKCKAFSCCLLRHISGEASLLNMYPKILKLLFFLRLRATTVGERTQECLHYCKHNCGAKP